MMRPSVRVQFVIYLVGTMVFSAGAGAEWAYLLLRPPFDLACSGTPTGAAVNDPISIFGWPVRTVGRQIKFTCTYTRWQ